MASSSLTDVLPADGWGDFILRRAGLSVRDSHLPALADLLHSRMRARGLTSLASYYGLLEAEANAGEEWTALVEHIVSRETSFFRHPASFAALAAHLLPELSRRTGAVDRGLSLMSAGCSTGQEAYSLAMVAMAAAQARKPFSVCGIDISRRAIETARRGRYSRRATAGVPAAYRYAFLRAVPASSSDVDIDEEVRRHVRFVALDLQTASDIVPECDVIFCQNVLIYFAPSAALALLSRLGSRLTRGGYLVPGPGEAPFSVGGLEAITVGGVRMFRRGRRTMSEVRS
jgi:chemotaxis methyl-accepting protein methylase